MLVQIGSTRREELKVSGFKMNETSKADDLKSRREEAFG
jgi:hypothetical protein